ncbi:MAG: hypothetical protein KA338_04875 [Chloroflexi bacterium]|nr:hypothetical protein [Chloroflexota bacterium]
MQWQMTYDKADGILYVKTSGVLEIESATQMRHEGAAILKQEGCLRCLLDHRDIEADLLQTMDIYNLPKRYGELGLSHALKMAVVVPAWLKENLQFYEIVCRNNGYSVSLFFDQESALAWLKA